MHRIDTGSAGPDNSFVNLTVPSPDWAQAVQEELAGVIEGAGDALDKLDNAQLLSAINTLIATSSTALQAQIDALETFNNTKGARSRDPSQGFPDATLTEIQWIADQYDNGGFYNAGTNMFSVPAGVTHVDASVQIFCEVPNSDKLTLELFQNNTRIASNSIINQSAVNRNEGVSVCALGVPAFTGDTFSAFLRPDGFALSSGVSGNFSIQARRFA